jgi:hypothetical protein
MTGLYERFERAWRRAVSSAKDEIKEDLGTLERADLVYELVIVRYAVAGYHEDVNIEQFDDVVSEIRSYLNRLFAHLTLQFNPMQREVQALWAGLFSCEFALVGGQPSRAYFDLCRATDTANIICNTKLSPLSELVTLRFLVNRFMKRVERSGNKSTTARMFELDAIASAIGAVVMEGELSLDTFPIEEVLEPILTHLEEQSLPNTGLVQQLGRALQVQ